MEFMRCLKRNFVTATHLFKGCVGAGLYAMGDCYKNGGLVYASIQMPIIAVLCVHCELMLIYGSLDAVRQTEGATILEYPDTTQKCFEYAPGCFKRIARTMRVLKTYKIDYGQPLTMLMCIPFVMIPSLFTGLNHIAPVSNLGNFFLMFGVAATLTVAYLGGMPSTEGLSLITNPPDMALSFGTSLFSYEGIALVLPLRNAMKDPNDFNRPFGILNVITAIITAIFIFTGVSSYIKWGEEVQGSITLNLDGTVPFNQAVKLIAALGVFLGYPIQFFIMIKIILPSMLQSCGHRHPLLAEVCLLCAALLVPNLELFISLIGALCSTTLAFVIPVLIDFAVKAQTPGKLTWYLFVKNIIILMIASFGIGLGTVKSMEQLVEAFKEDYLSFSLLLSNKILYKTYVTAKKIDLIKGYKYKSHGNSSQHNPKQTQNHRTKHKV
uniref:Amino acid transporter transmembrane domain-containing protein n=1 Tax=Glossina brevipalpis TaxID=37001 RepID=A0A1A9W358_9MUSC